ncbi:hypothetical protein GEV41_16025 [Pseudomonas putida]|uniref:hypothetical protein n=1 Tax=Pseudomonas putida TaxID=303 RepID=UPI00156D502A|nr:hypothetical protein [Pseudomonas putida]QKL07866.1 hypothetical protein GEV41_16025 [Pseudomonas putida]
MSQETKLKFQVSLFGDFVQYGVTEDNMRKCFESFFKLQMLPNQVQELNGAGQTTPRISLQSMGSGIMVNLLTDRLDVMALPMPNNPAAALSFEQFVEKGLPVAAELVKLFPAEITRVGVIYEGLLAQMPVEKLNALRDVFLGPKLAFAAGLPTNEWSVRDVVVGEVAGIASNFIYGLQRVKAQISDMSGHKEQESLHVLIDINTTTERGVAFKDFGVVSGYVNKAIEVQRQMKREVEGRIHG